MLLAWWMKWRFMLWKYQGMSWYIGNVLIIWIILYILDIYNELEFLDEVAAYGSISNSKEMFPDACSIRNYDEIKRLSIVYTWVNGTLPCYQESRKLYGGESSIGTSRDREIGELFYSIRSLIQFLPWHEGNIFIVTPGHIPKWLNMTHPSIQIIHQDDLFPSYAKEFLPTFNTNGIEQFLYRIPGLSDLFMQINDDYIFTAPISPHDFFSCDGGIRLLREPYPIPHGGADIKRGVWMSSALHTQKIMDDTWGYEPRHFLKHAPYIYSRRAFERIHEIFRVPLYHTLKCRFRSPMDMNIPLLHHYYLVSQGHRELGIPVSLPPPADLSGYQLILLDDKNMDDVKDIFRQILQGSHRSKLIALNDEYTDMRVATSVRSFLKQYLPVQSPYELPRGVYGPLSIFREEDGTCTRDISILPPIPDVVALTSLIQTVRFAKQSSFHYNFIYSIVQGMGLAFGVLLVYRIHHIQDISAAKVHVDVV